MKLPFQRTSGHPSKGGAISPAAETTSLYAKAFIEGFSKPSYVMLSLQLSGAMPREAFVRAVEQFVLRHPLLRSQIERDWLGLPARFVRRDVNDWLHSHCLTIDEDYDYAGQQRWLAQLLSTPMDLEQTFPFHGWLLTGEHEGVRRSTLVAKVHHCIVDAHAGRHLMLDYARQCAIALRSPSETASEKPHKSGDQSKMPDPSSASRSSSATYDRHNLFSIDHWRQQITDTKQWLRAAQLVPRVPDVSLLSHFQPEHAVTELPVTFAESSLPRTAFDALREQAARHKMTFSQWVACALFEAMYAYNVDWLKSHPSGEMPARLGLMVAVSKRFKRHLRRKQTGFHADTQLLSVPIAELSGNGDALRRRVAHDLQLQRDKHNDVALALVCASGQWRRLQSRARTQLGLTADRSALGESIGAVHLTFSDLTVGSTRLRRPLMLSEQLCVESIQYRVSPVASDHGGLLTYLYGDALRFAVMGHSGAFDAQRLLSELTRRLSQSTTEKQ